MNAAIAQPPVWDCVDYDDKSEEQYTVNYESFLDIGTTALPAPVMNDPLPEPPARRNPLIEIIAIIIALFRKNK